MDGFGALLNQTGVDAGIVWVGFKYMYLLAFGIYSVFSAVVWLQVKNMTGAVKQPFNAAVVTMATLHVGVALVATVLAFVIL